LFARLQGRLVERFARFRADSKQPYTAVVVPSQSFDPNELEKIDGVEHYEERNLFNLMLLRYPRLRVVYVTSKRLNPLIVDYLLHQIRSVPPAHARRRLVFLDCDDATPRPLSVKVLERPRLLERIRDSIDDPEMAHMNVFNASPAERALAVRLGIPLNACDPALTHLGTKSGSREVFEEAGLEVAPGFSRLRDAADLAGAVTSLWSDQPDLRRVVVKLDDSFSGEGNAILDLRAIDPGKSESDRLAAVRRALPNLRFEASGLDWERYQAQIKRMTCICETWVEGIAKQSPSVQLRINPMKEVLALSTHDQVLGGPSGQIFEGATFPAHPAYRRAIQERGIRVGEVLAQRGVIGRFGVDFVVVPATEPGGEPTMTAIEINLRQGGTTHPFNTLKFITGGRYDVESGSFFTAQGHERAYFATDTLRQPEYRGILPFDLIDAIVTNGTHFRADETGVVFHLLGCLSEFGKVGCTAIGPTVAEARALYTQTESLLDAMSGRVPPTPEAAP